MLTDPRWFDAVLTWLAALGVVRYFLHLERSRRRSFFEGRTRFLLACLGALLFVRGFFWLDPSTWLHRLTFIPATLLPLAMLLFVEGLLRRHLPRAMKIFVVLGTLIFLSVNFSDPDRRLFAYAFLTFLTLTLALLAAFLLLRDRASLSPPENRFLDAVSLACGVALVLSVTDFRTVLGFPSVRLGSIGALVFVHACVSFGARTGERLRGTARLLLRSAALGVALFLLSDRAPERWLASLALASTLTLLLSTWDRLWELAKEARGRSFLRWLLDTDLSSLAAFLGSLRDCPVAEEHLTLSGEQLGAYDVPAMVARLAGRRQAFSRFSRDPSAAPGAPGAIDGDEHLLALLETYGMSHVCLASLEPPVLLLMNHPESAEGDRAEIEMALVQKLALAIPR